MPRPLLVPLLRHLQTFLQTHQVQDSKTLVAVSGGPDSIALLQALHELAPSLHLTLLAAHFNHSLRGEESVADAGYVEQFCAEHNFPCVIEKANPTDLSPRQSHLESNARRLRYGWLVRTAQAHGCRYLMTGHTLNDQAETVLHHILRGTGLRGLRGIAPVKKLPVSPRSLTGGGPSEEDRPSTTTYPTLFLLRPLLNATRDEIMEFLAARNIAPRQDSSNADLRFTRNRIRQQVLPLLEHAINLQTTRHLVELAEQARLQYRRLQKSAAGLLRRALRPAADKIILLDQKVLASVFPDILQEALLQLWRRTGLPRGHLTSAHWRSVFAVCQGKRKQVQLPGELLVRHKLNVIQIGDANILIS